MLVRRVPQGAVLTDAGRLLVERGEAILARLEDAEMELQALTGLEGGTLRLATVRLGRGVDRSRRGGPFRERYPRSSSRIEMADPERVAAAAAGRRARPGALARRRVGDRAVDGGAGRPADDLAIEPSTCSTTRCTWRCPRGIRSADAGLGDRRLRPEPWMLATTDTCPDSRLFLRACHAAGFEPRDRLPERRLPGDPRVRRRRGGRGPDPGHGHPRRCAMTSSSANWTRRRPRGRSRDPAARATVRRRRRRCSGCCAEVERGVGSDRPALAERTGAVSV